MLGGPFYQNPFYVIQKKQHSILGTLSGTLFLLSSTDNYNHIFKMQNLMYFYFLIRTWTCEAFTSKCKITLE